MAISTTSTGSQWKIWRGTSEEVVNLMMVSGVGPANIAWGHINALNGSAAVGIHW